MTCFGYAWQFRALLFSKNSSLGKAEKDNCSLTWLLELALISSLPIMGFKISMLDVEFIKMTAFPVWGRRSHKTRLGTLFSFCQSPSASGTKVSRILAKLYCLTNSTVWQDMKRLHPPVQDKTITEDNMFSVSRESGNGNGRGAGLGCMQFLKKGTKQMLLELIDWILLNSIIDLQTSLFDVEV